ncbi:MAG: aromatic amino acid ammonia-lyase [Pseudomonadota bacterium]
MTAQDRSPSSVVVTVDDSLQLGAAYRVARGDAAVRLSDATRARCSASHKTLVRAVKEQRHIYGITTGFGPLVNRRIDPNDGVTAQQNLVYHLATGLGPALPWTVARAVMLARLTAIACGYSGASNTAVDALQSVLNSRFAPVLPERGTVGASGDLTPLAHVVLSLQGKGDFLTSDGTHVPAPTALAEIGMPPLTLANRDALALVNGTSAMTGIALVSAVRAQRLMDWALRLTAALGEVMGARAEAWAQIFAEVRPHPGQVEATKRLIKHTKGAARLTTTPVAAAADGEAGQDAYTLRCAPQVIGGCLDALHWHNDIVLRELNAVTDNPVFNDGEVPAWHGGNFMGQQIALASDTLTNALTVLAGFAERQIARVTDEKLNGGLPAFLHGGKAGVNSGFMGAQVTATAVVAEMRTRGPASVTSISTNGANQDVVSMGTIAARNAYRAVEELSEVLAILALVVSRGMDITEDTGGAYSPAARRLQMFVQKHSEPLDSDRPLSGDIAAVAKALIRNDSPV